MNGTEIGVLQDVKCTDDYAPEAISGIGDIHAQEYVPKMASHHIVANRMALRNSSLYSANVIPENGEAALEGRVFDIELYDTSTSTTEPIRKYLKCSYAGGMLTVTKNAVISEQCTFKALDVSGKM